MHKFSRAAHLFVRGGRARRACGRDGPSGLGRLPLPAEAACRRPGAGRTLVPECRRGPAGTGLGPGCTVASGRTPSLPGKGREHGRRAPAISPSVASRRPRPRLPKAVIVGWPLLMLAALIDYWRGRCRDGIATAQAWAQAQRHQGCSPARGRWSRPGQCGAAPAGTGARPNRYTAGHFLAAYRGSQGPTAPSRPIEPPSQPGWPAWRPRPSTAPPCLGAWAARSPRALPQPATTRPARSWATGEAGPYLPWHLYIAYPFTWPTPSPAGRSWPTSGQPRPAGRWSRATTCRSIA